EHIVLLVPLVRLSVHLLQAGVDDATHQEAEEEEDNDEAEETAEEDNDAAGIDVGHLVAGSFAVRVRIGRVDHYTVSGSLVIVCGFIPVISGHVRAPASPRGADR